MDPQGDPVNLHAMDGRPLVVNLWATRYRAEQGPAPREVLLDRGNRLGQTTGSFGLPTTLFYAADGRLHHSHMGELSRASLEHGLRQLP